MDKEKIILKCKKWVEQFVIGLQLCPFAKRPFEKGQIRFEVCFEKDMESQLVAFWKEINLLLKTPKEKISNTILIFSDGLNDFEKYLDLYFLSENLLLEQNKNEQFQLASFHPEYQFKNTEKNDVSNFTNRSPFPFIHILRVEEVTDAIAHYPDVEKVPERNIEKLKKMGIDGIGKLNV